MIQIGDRLKIKKNKQYELSTLFKNNNHNIYQDCGVDPYHINMKFVLVKTYDDKYIVRVFGGKQHYALSKNIFKKVD
jgi:hypothetical protein